MLNRQDFKTAFNSLLKAKAYVITIVLTLGITLGALVAMFNLNYQLLAKPLPYPDQDRLYIAKPSIYRKGQLEFSGSIPQPALVEAYKAKDDVVEQKALIKVDQDIIRSLPDVPQINISFVTPEYLSLLQVPMVLGRSFNADEGLYKNVPVAVLSFSTWSEIFRHDPDILTKTLQVGEVTYKIIGVTSEKFVEPQFNGVGNVSALWLPWDYGSVGQESREAWGSFRSGQHIVGKLKKDEHPLVVEQALTKSLNEKLLAELPADAFTNGISLKFSLENYRDAILGDSRQRVLLLFACALVLLLIAVVNIANLMLARVSNQQKNMAIRAAIGAHKSHLFNGLLAEILLLIVGALGLAFFVSLAGIEALKFFAKAELPRVAELHLNWQSLVFVLASGLLLALSFAFAVSRQVNYCALNKLLQSSGKGAGVQISARVRAMLVFSQVTFTAILLVASIQILVQSLKHMNQPLGFSEANIYRVSLNISSQAQLPISQQQKNNLLAIRQELLAYPKIASISLASDMPLDANKLWDYLSLTPDYQNRKQTLSTFVDQDYLSLLGFELIAGRNFTREEFNQGVQAIIINETLARKLQSDGKVLNKRFYWQNSGNGKGQEVIGIVRDLTLPREQELARMFLPYIASYNDTELLLKLKPQQTISKQELNEIMARVDSHYKVAEMLSLAGAHRIWIAQDIVSASLTAALTLIALSLAAIGIYGVLSYSVQLRRSELGIRMAIGARPQTIAVQIFKDNLTPVLVGLLFAAVCLLAIWMWIQKTNYSLQTNSFGWLLPPALMLLLTAVTSLLSVRKIIGKPASDVLRGD